MTAYDDTGVVSSFDYDGIFGMLFAGRTDAVGTEDGGCLRNGGQYDHRTWWRLRIDSHLNHGGEYAIGVYPVVDNAMKWACIDWDEGDEESWRHACNVRDVLKEFGVPMFIERSRSKGYHGWVFFRDWAPIEQVRKALVVACQIVEAPHREVNPKQFHLNPEQLGNYVRLPYPGRQQRADGKRNFILGTPQPFEWAVRAAWDGRVYPDQLQPLADMWVDPDPPVFAPKFIADTTADMYSRLDGLAFTVLRDGPRGDDDRSETLWKLAKSIAEHGQHTQSEAVRLLIEADTSWGTWHPKGPKFVHRTDGATQIARIVNKAWR